MKHSQLRITLGAMLVVLLLAACLPNQPPPDLATYPTSKAATQVVVPEGGRDLTADAYDSEIVKEEYDKLVEGTTTLEEAATIIGAEGRVIKTTKTKAGDVITYEWVGRGDLNKSVQISFRDGVLLKLDPNSRNVKGKIS
jgi:hypothetical protein